MKTNFCKYCPPSSNQEEKDDCKTNHQENCSIFPESIRFQLQPGNPFFLKLLPYAYILWLTVILFSGRSWRHPQYWKSNSTRNDRKSWCSDGGTWGASRHNQCSCCCLKLNWNDRIRTDHCSFFRTGNTTRINFKSADNPLMYFAPETNSKYLHRALTFQIYSPLTQHQWAWLPLEQRYHLYSNQLTWQISFNSSRICYLLQSIL